MTIAVASGKGGTGKTTIAVNLAYALVHKLQRVRLLDCDVEEPNDHLFVRPTFTAESPVTVPRPVFDADKCTGCGRCADACRYNAIAVVKGTVLFFPELCHSCGVCAHVCPVGAVDEEQQCIGLVRCAPMNQSFHFASGELQVGQVLSPRVVREVKTHIDEHSINILDAPPGTGCPVVETIDGADVVILVTEPTPFGLSDLKLAAELTLTLRVPTVIVVNKSDDLDHPIHDYARSVGIPVVGHIPFRRKYAETCSRGEMLVDRHPELLPTLLSLYERVVRVMSDGRPDPPNMVSRDDMLTLPPSPHLPADPTTEPSAAVRTFAGHQIAIISGKGGTGKTTVAAAFALLNGRKVLADTDVDSPNLRLLIDHDTVERSPFVGGRRAHVDPARCDGCGLCAESCRFDAFSLDGPANTLLRSTWRVEPFSCEGCGLCEELCPVAAIELRDAVTGEVCVSTTLKGPMVHARLGVAEGNSGRLVTEVRSRAAELAVRGSVPMVLGDGPPGIGCPVIASLSGVDLAVIVTEPTVSAVSDLGRALDLAEQLRVPVRIIINKCDLNTENTDQIEVLAGERGAAVVGSIPFDTAVNDALMAGKSVIEWARSAAEPSLRAAWDHICAEMEGVKTGSVYEDSRYVSR